MCDSKPLLRLCFGPNAISWRTVLFPNLSKRIGTGIDDDVAIDDAATIPNLQLLLIADVPTIGAHTPSSHVYPVKASWSPQGGPTGRQGPLVCATLPRSHLGGSTGQNGCLSMCP
jgi:hypothetical protein